MPPLPKAGDDVKRTSLFMALYQITGGLLLAPDFYTEGQRDRLTELVLNVLSNPEGYTAKRVYRLRDLALRP